MKQTITKRTRLICLLLITAIAGAAVGAGGMLYVMRSQSYLARGIRNTAQRIINPPFQETKGLENVVSVEEYVDNIRLPEHQSASAEDKYNRDVKKVYKTDTRQRLVNYFSGFSVDLPLDYRFHFELSPHRIIAEADGVQITLTREISPYDDVEGYVAYYLNRFILDETYQQENRIRLDKHDTYRAGKNKVEEITVTLEEMREGVPDKYTYLIIHADKRAFYRIQYRYHSSDKEMGQEIKDTIKSFRYFAPYGIGKYSVSWQPELPANWSKETRQTYDRIKNAETVDWGIFCKDIYGEGIEKSIPELEQKLDYKFPVILSYVHYGSPFPTEFMQKNYEEGRLIELTYQMTTNNNEDFHCYTPMLDAYRGLLDEEIRAFARDAKAFGKPFLFRLNNEMNSDWTSYSGVVNLSDPDIYISVWQRIYEIFEEEGVDNAIWIYNPNDRNYPPCNWNDFTVYYPGNKYVQMIGLTGYNNGTYYAEQNGEEWREFEQIYDEVNTKYKDLFGSFPWIITEFASSSYGGDKAKWIDNMFGCLDKYPNIKMAVWFSYADFNEETGVAARPYWLDETPETVEAFARGIKRQRD